MFWRQLNNLCKEAPDPTLKDPACKGPACKDPACKDPAFKGPTVKASAFKGAAYRARAAGVLYMCLLFTLAPAFLQPSLSISAIDTENKYRSNGNGNGNGLADAPRPVILKSIAILPIDNLSNEVDAELKVMAFIKKELKGKGWVLITKDDVVEKFLAKRRIRYTGAITRLTAREMGKALGVDAVFVGSLTQYEMKRGKVTVGVSARLVSTVDGNIIWADSVAYTGRDFQGFLGLGVIGTLEALGEVVVQDLVRGIADKFFLRDSALSPFEIERIVTFPRVVKAGGKVKLMVKLLPIFDNPREVRVLIKDREVILEKKGDTEFEGFVDAPEGEGVYLVDVVAMDGAMVPFSFDAAETIIVDSSPPVVELELSKTVFSPRSRGMIKLSPTLIGFERVEEWRMEVRDMSGKMVKKERGFGRLPAHIVWRGYSDKRKIVEDGKYTCDLIVTDAAGNETFISNTVQVKSTPPELLVDVEMLDDETLTFYIDNTNADELESWTLKVVNRAGDVLKVFDGEGDIPAKLDFTVDDDARKSRLAYTVMAKDTAGNSFVKSRVVPMNVTRKMPFAKLKSGEGIFVSDF